MTPRRREDDHVDDESSGAGPYTTLKRGCRLVVDLEGVEDVAGNDGKVALAGLDGVELA